METALATSAWLRPFVSRSCLRMRPYMPIPAARSQPSSQCAPGLLPFRRGGSIWLVYSAQESTGDAFVRLYCREMPGQTRRQRRGNDGARFCGVYSEFSPRTKPMQPEANIWMFNTVEVESGDSIRLDQSAGVITLGKGTYHILATSIVTPFYPDTDTELQFRVACAPFDFRLLSSSRILSTRASVGRRNPSHDFRNERTCPAHLPHHRASFDCVDEQPRTIDLRRRRREARHAEGDGGDEHRNGAGDEKPSPALHIGEIGSLDVRAGPDMGNRGATSPNVFSIIYAVFTTAEGPLAGRACPKMGRADEADFVEEGVGSVWSGRGDLNPRPPEPHSGTLPGCATARLGVDASTRNARRGQGNPAAQRIRYLVTSTFFGVGMTTTSSTARALASRSSRMVSSSRSHDFWIWAIFSR